MSFAAMTWASKQKTGSPTRKLILLLLADRSNDDGYCWPSLKTIAEDCELKKDAVIRNLKRLEDDGFIRIIKRKVDGAYLQNHYQLNISNSNTNGEVEGGSSSKRQGGYGEQGVVAQSDKGSSSKRQGVVAQSDTNQSIEPVIEPNTGGDGLSDGCSCSSNPPSAPATNVCAAADAANSCASTKRKSTSSKLPAYKPKNFSYPENFERLWSLYRVGDKWAAYKAYHRRSKDYSDEELERALKIESRKEFGKRHFSTVLNGDIDELISQHENDTVARYGYDLSGYER